MTTEKIDTNDIEDLLEDLEPKKGTQRKRAMGEPKRGYDRDPTIKQWREVASTLTPFEYKFVLAYCKTQSTAEAARMAGTTSSAPERVGWNTLNRPRVQTAVAIAMRRRLEAAGLDSTEVIENLREIYRVAMEDGKYADAVKATRLLGEYLRMWTTTNTRNAEGKIGNMIEDLRSKEVLEYENSNDKEVITKDVTNMVRIIEAAKLRDD